MSDTKGVIHGILEYCWNIVFVGSYGHLWYFPALIFSVVVISYLLSKKISLRNIITVAFCFYIIGLLTQSWFGIIKPLECNSPEIWLFLKTIQKVIITRDGLGIFEVLLFVGMGAYVAFYDFKLPRKSTLIGLVVSFILMFIEAMGLKQLGFVRDANMYLFLVPVTWFMFGLIVNYRISSKSTIFETLKALSSLMFYIHLWIKWFLNKFFIIIGVNVDKTCLLFILAVCVSIVASYVIYSVSNIERFNWLKKLYS